jgi:hypothetical protein
VIEVLVRFDDSRAGRVLKCAIRLGRRVRYQLFDVGETHVEIGVQKIRNEKTRPCIARSRIGHYKGVVGIDPEIALGSIATQKVAQHLFDSVNHLLECSVLDT